MNRPFLLRPTAKDYIWGGNRLNTEFPKDIDMSPLAETWECSTHPDGPSYVASGEYAGMTLAELLDAHPELMGEGMHDEFPILVKFIDAKSDLSVQVHPSDEYAAKYENGQKGKSEMWYVVDAAPDAHLVYGLKYDMSREDFRASIESGRLEEHLMRIPVKRGDMLYIDAGTIHAICGGVLIAEVQENSNLTYRIYDYGRRDKNGKLRELHVDKALAVSKLAKGEMRTEEREVTELGGAVRTSLCANKYFTAAKLDVNTEKTRGMYSCEVGKDGFRVLLCTEGCGTVFCDGEVLTFFRGDCIFFPADTHATVHAKCEFLEIGCG